jgi:hypothetical protein
VTESGGVAVSDGRPVGVSAANKSTATNEGENVTRIGHILVQAIDEDGVVIVDESDGNEIFIPTIHLAKVYEALGYFVPLLGKEPHE